MVAAPENVDDRIICYKQSDANFYSPFPYVIGKALSLMPQNLIDVLIFGTIIYWMVGLPPYASNFFIYIAVLWVFAMAMNQMLAMFAAISKTKSDVQGISGVILLFLVLFCGFIVSPAAIPDYYIWIYWWNPLAWAYRAILVNIFLSDDYPDGEGASILAANGFTLNGEPFDREWIGYCFAYLVPYSLLCIFFTGVGLATVRVQSEASGAKSSEPIEATANSDEEGAATEAALLPFQPVNLTFQDLNYDVKASKGKEMIRLLHDVSGIFESGRMCALMG